MPDSVVNVAAAFSIIFPVRTVYFAPARALELSPRMLPGESRVSFGAFFHRGLSKRRVDDFRAAEINVADEIMKRVNREHALLSVDVLQLVTCVVKCASLAMKRMVWKVRALQYGAKFHELARKSVLNVRLKFGDDIHFCTPDSVDLFPGSWGEVELMNDVLRGIGPETVSSFLTLMFFTHGIPSRDFVLGANTLALLEIPQSDSVCKGESSCRVCGVW